VSDLAKRAENVLRLAWLSPSAASLAVLGRLPTRCAPLAHEGRERVT